MTDGNKRELPLDTEHVRFLGFCCSKFEILEGLFPTQRSKTEPLSGRAGGGPAQMLRPFVGKAGNVLL